MTDDVDVEVPSGLDYLKTLLAERRDGEARRVVLRDTLARPDVALTCRVPSDSVEFAALVKRSEELEKKKGALPGGLLLACMTLARYCEQASIDGRTLTPGDGAAFAYPQLQQVLGVDSAWQAVRALLKDDFAAIRLFDQLTDEAGIGAKTVSVSESDEDPT